MNEEAGRASLAESFRRLIASAGPMPIAHYMAEANARYYNARDPLGQAGDFITAPEVSQMFGELVGLWLADIWLKAQRAGPLHYVELGPGRGTLARDALRAMKRYGVEPQVHLVEASQALRRIQQDRLEVEAVWHHDLSSVPDDGPILLVANEFLDALPVRQLVRTAQGWRERMVVPEGGRFACVAGERPMDAAVPEERRDAEEGTILETCPGAAAVVEEVASRLASQQGAALFIDYGYAQAQTGSTLQAVKGHHKVDPFVDPGDADLSALVDFATLARIAENSGARWLGTVPQGQWLRALGIELRADALATFAPQHREEIMAAKDRLAGDEQMGALFKVMGLTHPAWPDGAGFAPHPV
ncbi:MAG TPA: SAM-dependent methyltransferase [Sphingomonadaceae bacterium]|nr:SAM-dependent methyltransferase [Sphingomonadaceae bacterium]